MLNESSLALHPSEPGVLYFGTQGGVFRSIDRGDTWQALLTVSVSDISICSTVPGVMYVAGRTLQRSQDAGETWEVRGEELPSDESHFQNQIAVHPENPNVVYLGTAHVELDSNEPGVYKSVDGGMNLKPIGLEGHAITTLAIDSRNPAIVYAGGGTKLHPDGTFLSRDGGETWTIIHDSGSSMTLELDPANQNVVYEGTNWGLYRYVAGSGFNATSVRKTGWGQIKTTQ